VTILFVVIFILVLATVAWTVRRVLRERGAFVKDCRPS
jgi:hypothetical protein